MVYEEAEQPRAARDDAPYEHDNEELAPRDPNFGATRFDGLPRPLAVDIRRWRSRPVLSEQTTTALCGRETRSSSSDLRFLCTAEIRDVPNDDSDDDESYVNQRCCDPCTNNTPAPQSIADTPRTRARGHTVNHTNTCTQVSGGNFCAAAVRTGCGASLGTAAPHYAVARRPRRGDVERQPRPACRER